MARRNSKHATRPQKRGNGWLDPRGTREAHENRDMTNRKGTPKVKTLAPKKKGARR